MARRFWQARLRSSPLLVVTEDKQENGKSMAPDATEFAVLLGPVKEWPEDVVRAEPLGQRPSLTAPVRDGPENPRVGTEGWAPRGAEQKDDLCRSSDRPNKESKKEVLVTTFLFLTSKSPYKGAG